MNLIISYTNLYHNWYVGEFYTEFHKKLKSISNINIDYVSLSDLASHYNIPSDYSNGFPSVFNPYNLIITNKDNGKTFIHSWHDYAPAILVNGSGIELLDVVKFACVSRLDESIIKNNKTKIIIQPSFYLLENWDEHSFIENNRYLEKKSDRVFFNGLCYGVRGLYKNILDKSNFFDFKRKDGPDYKTKEDYYSQMSSYKYGLSLDGAAKICYRDIEYFGMGILSLREKLDVMTCEPIIPDINYIELIDDDIKSKISNQDYEKYIIDKLENNLSEIFSDKEKINYIINNSRKWYEKNCLPENQINLMLSFFENFTIFE
jgi:hypothetical protein